MHVHAHTNTTLHETPAMHVQSPPCMKKKIILNTHYTCRRSHLKTGAEEKAIPGTDI